MSIVPLFDFGEPFPCVEVWVPKGLLASLISTTCSPSFEVFLTTLIDKKAATVTNTTVCFLIPSMLFPERLCFRLENTSNLTCVQLGAPALSKLGDMP